MLKNLNANANSRKPSTTFTVFIQPPDLGRLLSHSGNMAKSVNGMAKAIENANMPRIGFSTNPPADSTKMVPTIGPVQEKETNTKVNAIKNVP